MSKRIIKFRAYDELMKRFRKKCEITNIIKDFYSERQDCSLSNMTFQQFTGLTDKNGVEIYESDILKSQVYVYSNDFSVKEPIGVKDEFVICKYDSECARFNLDLSYRNNLHSLDFHKHMIHKFEVVGNEFENPDLLEKLEK